MKFKEFFGLCNHKWEEKETMEVMKKDDKIIGVKVKLKCKNCGIIKFITNTIFD